MPIDDDSARRVAQLDANADRLAGLSLTSLGYDDEEPVPGARALSLRRTRLLAGAIRQSCSSLMDDSSSDLRQFD
ncbi:MAG: hypothetical protein MOP51_52 [Citricoccus sp.]|nr:hypothetical protein [Citricoccus sp. WCRC_4]